jgi:hypothetical protein
MTALVIVLVLTNVATLVLLVVLMRHRLAFRPAVDDVTDVRVADAISSTARPVGPAASAGRTRRVITIEILNPIELAGVRGRMFGIAGSFVPHLTRRIVYDQTVRQLREQLATHHVVADVRIHVLPAEPPDAPGTAGTPLSPAASVAAEPIRLEMPDSEPTVLDPGAAYEPPAQ